MLELIQGTQNRDEGIAESICYCRNPDLLPRNRGAGGLFLLAEAEASEFCLYEHVSCGSVTLFSVLSSSIWLHRKKMYACAHRRERSYSTVCACMCVCVRVY